MSSFAMTKQMTCTICNSKFIVLYLEKKLALFGLGPTLQVLSKYNKNPYIRTKKLRTFEAEIFCYTPSEQRPSPA